jgi:hypothetical protein
MSDSAKKCWCCVGTSLPPFERWWRHAGDPKQELWVAMRDILHLAFEAGRHSVLGHLEEDVRERTE